MAEVVRHARRLDAGLPPGVRLDVTPSAVPGKAASVFLELDEGAYGRWMRHVPLSIEIEDVLPAFSFPIEKGPNSMTTEFNEPTVVAGHAYVVRGRDPESGERIELLRKVLR